MATEAPDPRTFKSWEDAFQYPIPVVRKLESQLRSNAGDNREKLRSLVGASYRDLLDTAETIISMEKSMQQVEITLGRAGQRCNSRAVDRITRNTAKLDEYLRARDHSRYAFASQLAVLQSCPIVISRLIKNRSYLLAAKVLVISRLIHKDLAQATDKPVFVDQVWNKIGTLRRRLRDGINKQFASSHAETTVLIESMCAYALVTSSTPSDVLQHFHHVRLQAVKDSFEDQQDLARDSLKSLRLCLKTVQDTIAIFPRRLADSLSKLKTRSLMQDPEIRALAELNLDIHERWIAEEARNFTPWPRHDELHRSEAEKLLTTWAKQAIAAFLKGIKSVLSGADDLQALASLRQSPIEAWITSGTRIPGLRSAAVLDDLRDVLNAQLKEVAAKRAEGLDAIASQIVQVTEDWPIEKAGAERSLWNIASSSLEIGNGAVSFKNTILNTSHGRDGMVLRIVDMYDKWSDSVQQLKATIKVMKESRWDDDLGDEGDDSDEDFELDSKQSLLSEDDPKLLEEAIQEALSVALSSLRTKFTEIVNNLTADQDQATIAQAIFIVRVAREIGERLPRLWSSNSKSAATLQPFSPSLFEPLYRSLAQNITRPCLESYRVSLSKYIRPSGSQAQILWEGNPPLPAQPSPSTFRFLRNLVKEMGMYGGDLWTPGAVRIMKMVSGREICTLWRASLSTIESLDYVPVTPEDKEVDGQDKSEAENHEDGEKDEGLKDRKDTKDAKEIQQEKLKQVLFDMLYAQRYLGLSEIHDQENSFESILKAAYEALGTDDGTHHRLQKNAADYGKKTYLLFALLS